MFIRDIIIPTLVTGLLAFASTLLELMLKMLSPKDVSTI